MKFEFKAVVTFLESSAFLTTIIWLSSDMGFRRKLKKTPEREINLLKDQVINSIAVNLAAN